MEKPLSSTPGGKQTYVLTDFFVRNSIPNNFYWKLFLMYCVFLASLSPKVNLISHFCTLEDFKLTDLWRPLAPLMEEMDICARELFCSKFNSEQLLFEAFLIYCVFLASLSPKVNLISHFCTLKDFKQTDLWSPQTPLMGEINLCARELFCTKLYSEQLLFEAFFDVLCIFGITEPQSVPNFPFLFIIKF